MAEHIWSVLCDLSITDRDSNKMSLIGLINDFVLPFSEAQIEAGLAQWKEEARPTIPVFCELVTAWRRSQRETPEVVDLRVVVEGPRGEHVATQAVKVDLSKSWGLRTRIQLQGLPLLGIGSYLLKVCRQSDDPEAIEIVASLPYRIVAMPPPEQQGEEGGGATSPSEPAPPSEPTPSALKE